MSDATSQRAQLGSGSGLTAVECPRNVQPVSKRLCWHCLNPVSNHIRGCVMDDKVSK